MIIFLLLIYYVFLSNILLKNKHIKISDIDFSKDINNKTRDFEKKSNIYFSPELMKRNFITSKTDIWYFIIIAHSIFFIIIFI